MAGAAASAVTGGVGATGGETVVTGDSSASVQVTNVINADNDGGTSHTIIEKTVDGVKKVTEETKNFAPGEPVEVNVTVEANSGGKSTTNTSLQTETESGTETEEATTTATGPESQPDPQSFTGYIFKTISGFFAGVWSWFSN